ncbi:MAG: GntR family transcriptional regulator [Candidatus Atribacteria bacterium]|nr:GntR family transcriptional regulator [Candidatus Atribacteria bacterium]
MDIKIDKNSRIPLYLQIREYLKKALLEGQVKQGYQLPTERELSIKLNVSRNTVSMAYKELSQEKIISSTPGKGTFIVSDQFQVNPLFNKKENSLLVKSIDLIIQKALNLNISTDDLASLIHQRIQEKSTLFKNVRIAFIECNQEQLIYFSKKLELGTGVHIIPILIDEMYHTPEDFIRKIKPVDLIVTTFFHFEEVRTFLKDQDKKIVAIALDPQIETMVKIARVAFPDMRIGLVCLTQKFAERVFKSIKYAGIKYKSISYMTTHEEKILQQFIDKCDILITSPGRKKQVQKLRSKEVPLIEFIYIPDKGSIDTLKKTILELQKKEVS